MSRITRGCVLFLWIHTLTFVKSQPRNCTLESFLKSNRYNSNFDTSTLEESYHSGRQVRVGCVVGYTGFYKLICDDGSWQHRGTHCQPRSCGHPGDAQFADFHLVEGDDFVFGSQVTYTCHKGYHMVSRKNYRTCLAGGWDGSVPVCEAQSCQSFEVGDNIVVNGDTQDATYGNVVRFNCRSNADVLYGSSEMYCDENGKWVGTVPECKAVKCTAPDIENGYVPGDIQRQTVYNEHEILHFACNDLYRRAEDRPSKCTKVGEKAEFSPTPLCELIKCRLDQMTPKGTTYEPAYKNLFLPTEKVTVRCGDKYYFSHFRETSAEVRCQEDGHWAENPICKEVICERRHPHVSWFGWGQIKLDQTVDYRCEYGYKKTTNRATCTRDKWMPNPLCEEIKCYKERLENAVLVDGKPEYKYDEVAEYRCKEGYKGDPTRACKESGWTGRTQCSEIKCGRATVKNADIVGNKVEYKYNEKAYYRCHEGFKGKPVRTCQATGLQKADRNEADCTVISCEIETFDHARANVGRKRSFRYDEDVKYTCNGHRGSFTRTCGEDGWTGSTSCSACPKAQVNNGFVLPSSTDPDTVHYACNKGFKLFTKGWWGEAKCNGREWVGLQHCIGERECGEIPAFPNGDMSRRQSEAYSHGQAVEIKCKAGYEPRLRHARLTCQEGKWISRSSLETVCELVPDNCKPPPVVENAVVESPYQDEYVYRSHVTYKCHDNYTIGTENTLYCMRGKWEERNIQCSRLCDKLKDENKSMNLGYYGNQDRYRDGEVIHYECVVSRERGTATCENGEWTKTVECEAPAAPQDRAAAPDAQDRAAAPDAQDRAAAPDAQDRAANPDAQDPEGTEV